MLRAALLLALLALPSALAGVAVCPSAAACADAWSAKKGSCGGAGSERNTANATSETRDLGRSSVSFETFCLRANGEPYNEVRLDLATQGEHAYVGWYNDDGACSLVVFTEGPRLGPGTRRMPCHSATPPVVPALLP